ncbi:hypothetical protein [uncultured Hoeflea sp.]|uniref:hypothetical protein n=1 Tax=uncultured Hoeflea sp. TaxID=538666 RepID=UPI002603BA6E|nr:hypothetical protein [uncultured Hoeflea sp.]
MVESRARKLARLVRVQRQIERMAEDDLSQVLRQQAIVDATQDALVEAVGSFDPVHAAMSHQYAQRFQRLSAKSQQLDGMKLVQERRVLSEKTKADRLAERADEAAQNEERADADESLLDLLETRLGKAAPGTRPA